MKWRIFAETLLERNDDIILERHLKYFHHLKCSKTALILMYRTKVNPDTWKINIKGKSIYPFKNMSLGARISARFQSWF